MYQRMGLNLENTKIKIHFQTQYIKPTNFYFGSKPARLIPMEEAYPMSTGSRSDAVKKYVKMISSSI
jgi:hypothetical protein